MMAIFSDRNQWFYQPEVYIVEQRRLSRKLCIYYNAFIIAVNLLGIAVTGYTTAVSQFTYDEFCGFIDFLKLLL